MIKNVNTSILEQILLDSNCTLEASELQRLNANVDNLNSKVTQQTKKLHKLHNTIRYQRRITNDLQDMDTKFMEFKEAVMTELQTASMFMSDLQTKCQNLCDDFRDHKEMIKVQDKKVVMSENEDQIITMKLNENMKLKEYLVTVVEHVNFIDKDVLKIKDAQRKMCLKEQNIQKDITRSNGIEFLCQKSYTPDVQCVKDCLHVIGQHDQQISEGGENDLHAHLEDCMRNPGHVHFTPIDTLCSASLPEGNQNNIWYSIIKAVADLTVRVSVTMTSLDRPEFWPNTKVPYFLYNMRGSQHLRTGSGKVEKVIKFTNESCPCETCRHSDKPNTEWWKIKVYTAANVVFDGVEARHTTCRFFYDTEESPEISLQVVVDNDFKTNIKGDWSCFCCVTCNKKLAETLQGMVEDYDIFNNITYHKYNGTSEEDKLMFTVSHPHGCCKLVSLGQWKDKYTSDIILQQFTYYTCTCAGCSGAPVYCVGHCLHYHSGSLKSGLCYSNYG
ncbi:STE20-like serine/threonine-protein kinase isoform X2 [Biomphalaria glabrata]